MLMATGLLLAACAPQPMMQKTSKKEQPVKVDVLVYGRPTCSRCKAFMRRADAEKIDYQFFNIDENRNRHVEMWDKLEAAGFGDNVGLPVIDIVLNGNSHVFSNPEFEKVARLFR